jgi:hypothetical protein
MVERGVVAGLISTYLHDFAGKSGMYWLYLQAFFQQHKDVS